jgi:hypothetical protein
MADVILGTPPPAKIRTVGSRLWSQRGGGTPGVVHTAKKQRPSSVPAPLRRRLPVGGFESVATDDGPELATVPCVKSVNVRLSQMNHVIYSSFACFCSPYAHLFFTLACTLEHGLIALEKTTCTYSCNMVSDNVLNRFEIWVEHF